MIHLENLSFSWPGSAQAALNALTLHIRPASIVCVCAPNGSGKSTLLQVLGSLLAPQHGAMRYAPGREKPKTAFMLQDADSQILGTTVAEDILIPWPEPDEATVRKARSLAKQFALEGVWNTPVHQLSYGQKRKLCLVSALMLEPELLLLDEPSSGLDYPGICQLRASMKGLRSQGLCQVVSSHDLEPFADITDAVLVLISGKQLFYGPVEGALDFLQQHPEAGVRVPALWRSARSLGGWEQGA